jgi:methyltransferase-like protein
MEAAASKGMQFVAEAWSHTRTDDLPPAVNRQIQDISPDLLHVEQYLDFLRRRTFRRTLLCHESVSLSRSPTNDQVMGMSASHLAMPVDHADLPAGTVRYRTAGGQSITTNHPALMAIFSCLWERHPHVVPVSELLVHARAALPQETPLAACPDGDLIGLFLKCFLANALLLHVHPPCFATQLSAKPCATRLSRAQARLQLPVANLWHRHMQLNELDRHVLSWLDGEHDRASLVTELGDALKQGAVTAELLRSAAPDVPWPEPGPDLGDYVDVSLQRLFSQAFLLS